MQKKKLIIGIVLSIAGFLEVIVSLFADVVRARNFSIGPAQLVIFLAGFALFLLGLGIIKRSYPYRFLYSVSILLFISGMILLALNVYGQFVSLRNPKIYNGLMYQGRLRIPKKPEEIYPQLQVRPQETKEDFAYRLTQVAYEATVHYWNGVTNYTEFNHRIPIYENFLLWWQFPGPHEFCNPYKAIERGVSICSQVTKIIVNVWKQNGFRGDEVALDGHVIAEVIVGYDSRNDPVKWVLDGDFGVVFEHNLDFLQDNLKVVKQGYLDAGYPESSADHFSSFYGPEGNYVITTHGGCNGENFSYKLKWLIPLGLVFPLLLFTHIEIRRKRKHI
ncbi:MAG: hypothetical protein HZB50_15960 [Chloroflexi bacterium]|nr:hypothetical protein [Chloroflexota bacterium]